MPNYTLTENTTAQNSSDTPTSGVTEDNWLQESDGGTTNNGSETFLETTKWAPGDHNHTLIRFDTSSISASETVTSATLYLYRQGGNAESHDVAAREILQNSWTEVGSNWGTYDGSTSWNTAGCLGSGSDRTNTPEDTTTITTTNQYYSFDLTTLVNANLGGDVEVHLELDEVGNSGDFVQFTSSEGTDGQCPELVIVTTTGGGGDSIPYLLNQKKRRFKSLLVR